MKTQKFNPIPIIADLKRNKAVISALLIGIEPDLYLFREQNNRWNILENLCHLCDEEREDFVVRLKSVLIDPSRPLPPIDPEGWVNSRRYLDQNYDNKLVEWQDLRIKNCLFLDSLKGVHWDNAFQHQHFGSMSAKLFLCNWLSHDYHHIRQIIAIKRAYVKHTTEETLEYAGNW